MRSSSGEIGAVKNSSTPEASPSMTASDPVRSVMTTKYV